MALPRAITLPSSLTRKNEMKYPDETKILSVLPGTWLLFVGLPLANTKVVNILKIALCLTDLKANFGQMTFMDAFFCGRPKNMAIIHATKYCKQ